MAKNKKTKLWKLILRYKQYLFIGLFSALLSIGTSLGIFYSMREGAAVNVFWGKLADFLMTFGETILGAGLIGGGIGASINFILEELNEEEEAVKERLKRMQESREKRKLFRQEMRYKLQQAHDEVELARILIRSHKSGKSYGEQVRNRIMPSLISLVEFKRSLMDIEDIEDTQLTENLAYLKVSLRYMIAYLSVLVEEFEEGYLKISNLQNYQDALTGRMKILFLEVLESSSEQTLSLKEKKKMLKKAKNIFEESKVPPNVKVVWSAIKKLDYIWDFRGELRNKKGERSKYNQFFLQHYYHCKKLLKQKGSTHNEKIISKFLFRENLHKLTLIEEKEKNDRPLTKQDSLTRRIMEKELGFKYK